MKHEPTMMPYKKDKHLKSDVFNLFYLMSFTLLSLCLDTALQTNTFLKREAALVYKKVILGYCGWICWEVLTVGICI